MKLLTIQLNTWLIAACAMALDQISKWVVLELLDLPTTGTLVLVPDFIKLVLVWNKGVNFGLLPSDSLVLRWFLVAIAVTVCLGLSWWIRNGAEQDRRWGVGLIVGGALGNAFDRVAHGAVADFLNVSGFGIENPFSFNVADVWIFIGVALIVLGTSRKPRKEGNFDQQSPS